MKKFVQEFKDFALRGNVMDLAVGVIIGGAFQQIVNALVDNIIMPFINLFTRTDGIEDLYVQVGTAQITYGAFLAAVLNFIIMAFVIFLLVKLLNKLTTLGKKPQGDVKPTTKKCPFCFTDIPYEATRCPNCTAEIPQSQKPVGVQ